jgi:hypothetical protein
MESLLIISCCPLPMYFTVCSQNCVFEIFFHSFECVSLTLISFLVHIIADVNSVVALSMVIPFYIHIEELHRTDLNTNKI